MTELKAYQELETKVIKEGLCTLCGACTDMCPYWTAYKGRIVLRDACDLSQGRCNTFCPRISVDLDDISKVVFGAPYTWCELGTVQEVLMARSTDATIKARAQYGGVVTALICYALDEGLIDSAVLTCSEDKSSPEGVIVSTKGEVLNSAGSSYAATPTLEAFNRGAKDDNRKRIGVVGTPCQVLALAKMKASDLDERNNIEKVNLVIGLFCTWALSYDGFAQFLKGKTSLSKVTKLDIPPPPANTFEIYTDSERISVPLDEIRKFIMPACTYCTDMTGEFADISAGAVEGIAGWNTVIVRTDTGKSLIEAAAAKKVIELRKLPSENLNHLKEASLLKKKRALRDIIKKTGSKDDLLYLKVQGNIVEQMLDE